MAKLVRDRSTPEKDEWWNAVQQSARMAPTLTYEMEDGMASEDVLERARRDVIYSRSDRPGLCALIDDLAAEVRELRKDRERLDWMQQMNSEVFWINAKLCEVTLGLTVGSGEADDLRSAIDAAIAAAKGED